MKYIVTGETFETHRNISPEELTLVLEKGIILNLDVYDNLGISHKITPNGTAKAKTGVAIVDGESSDDIFRKLECFPPLFNVNWTVTPLDNF